ncbi:MAG TPA: hypothetical protein VHN98_06110 [Acidimicrobiales bacterium]|nr:hypothetical protein [Acidimicrobiales bacterium]
MTTQATTAPVRPTPPATLGVWVAVFAGIALWAVHIVACASLVRFACHDRWAVWAMHGITAVTGLLTVVAIVACWRFTVGSDHRTEDGIAPLSQRRFLGVFGLGVNGISLALILLEGIYVVFLSPCI